MNFTFSKPNCAVYSVFLQSSATGSLKLVTMSMLAAVDTIHSNNRSVC